MSDKREASLKKKREKRGRSGRTVKGRSSVVGVGITDSLLISIADLLVIEAPRVDLGNNHLLALLRLPSAQPSLKCGTYT